VLDVRQFELHMQESRPPKNRLALQKQLQRGFGEGDLVWIGFLE
jgi:hypothetical protein